MKDEEVLDRAASMDLYGFMILRAAIFCMFTGFGRRKNGPRLLRFIFLEEILFEGLEPDDRVAF